MASPDDKPLINKNQLLQDYFNTLESRIGYRLVLGRTRHFGFYTSGSYWPFPISKALRAMEDNLISALALKKGSKVLDAGCGVGHVAIHLAMDGYCVYGIDVVDHHIIKARRNIEAKGLEGKVTIAKADYHHLSSFADGSFDGIYTMETFVHATEPEVAAAEFFRVIRPGGSLAMYEYDHVDFTAQTTAQGVLEGILEEAGFEDITVKNLSENVLPMLRMFYFLAFIPYRIIAFLGLKARFVNTVAGYEGYIHRDAVRYIAVSAKKPLATSKADSREGGEASVKNCQ